MPFYDRRASYFCEGPLSRSSHEPCFPGKQDVEAANTHGMEGWRQVLFRMCRGLSILGMLANARDIRCGRRPLARVGKPHPTPLTATQPSAQSVVALTVFVRLVPIPAALKLTRAKRILRELVLRNETSHLRQTPLSAGANLGGSPRATLLIDRVCQMRPNVGLGLTRF
jgi:hypothetical protein